MAIALDHIIKEADMLQTRLKNGYININELDSFLVRVRKLSAPKDRDKVKTRETARIADAMEKLNRSSSRVNKK